MTEPTHPHAPSLDPVEVTSDDLIEDAGEDDSIPDFMKAAGQGIAAPRSVPDRLRGSAPTQTFSGAPPTPWAGALLRNDERLGVESQFRIVRPIGSGGMAEVYEGRDTRSGRLVAIKIVSQPTAPRLLELFQAEIVKLGRLEHEHIVRLYDSGTWCGHPFMVMQRLFGEPLSERLREGRGLPLEEAVILARQMVSGIGFAHDKGVIHRDLKPANVFLVDGVRAVILDFGLGVLDPDRLSVLEGDSHGAQVRRSLSDNPLYAGTPLYMAPEQHRGEAQDERADLWALGVIFFEMLTGRPAFARARHIPALTEPLSLPDALLSSLSDTLHEPLTEIIHNTISPRPNDRFDTASDLDEALVRLQDALVALRQRANVPDGEPYRYLEAFQEADRGWFFGRGEETRHLARRLKGRSLVVVLGPSGAGKSSLVRAGLIPALHDRDEAWSVILMTPGDHPFRALRERLRALGMAISDESAGPDSWATSPGAIGELLRAHARQTGRRVLWCVDQFEALFTRGDLDPIRASFIQALVDAGDDPDGPLRVVLTLRSDFQHLLDPLPELTRTLDRFNLDSPGSEALKAALVEPARLCCFEFEAGLVESMIKQVQGEPTPLPLLQFAASKLWERRDEATRTLTRAALSRLGGVEGMMAAHAEELWGGLLDPRDRQLCREILCRLVNADNKTRNEQPRDTLIDGLDDQPRAERTLQQLIDGRILTASHAHIQIAHESLLTRWDRLHSWLTETQAQRQFRERLANATGHWRQRERSSDVLWRGQELEEALALRKTTQDRLSPDEDRFLQESVVARERERKRSRRLQTTLVGLSLLMVAAALLAGYFAWQSGLNEEKALDFAETSKRNEQQAREAEAIAKDKQIEAKVRELAAHSVSYQTSDPKLSLMLAREAVQRRPIPAAVQSLFDVFEYARELATLTGHRFSVQRAAFSPDGKSIITASDDGTAKLWDLEGKLLATITGHQGEVWSAGFSPDGKSILTASRDKTAKLWDLKGKLLATLTGHQGEVRSAAFSPDGKSIITASDDWTARLWVTPEPALLLARAAQRATRDFTPEERLRFGLDD